MLTFGDHVQAFKAETGIRVILLGIKAGGEGLNLQEASFVFVLEPWWNPQVRPCVTHRFKFLPSLPNSSLSDHLASSTPRPAPPFSSVHHADVLHLF